MKLGRMTTILLLTILLPANAVLAEDWLSWGGPNGDFTVDVKGLTETWPESGPKQLWKRALGDGYSSILHKDGRLYTMYRDGESEVVVALDAGTGKTLWEHRYPREPWPEMAPVFGVGPNATPLIVGDRIVSASIDGQLRCLDLATGKLQWKHDLPAEFGRVKRVEEYGYSASPMEYRGTVIVHAGGDKAAMIAIDPKDGSILWKSEPGAVSYAQPTITTLAGKEQFLYFEPAGIVSLDPSTGKALWRAPIPVDNGNHLTPMVKCDESHIWVSSQFLPAGGRLIEITASEDGKLQAEELLYEKRLRASHWTMIPIGDVVYGSTGGNDISFLTAFEWRTGKTIWRERGFHKAQALYADGKFLFIDENGLLAIARVSPEGMELLAKAQVTEADSWTLPTLVGTTLYARDRKNILALDLAKSTD
ncbi:MAG: PQQ-binding-like beta-propeller repeat protein [Planctomycetota bacterium]|jgi:outer membrane protein assembly factor BamB